MSDRFFPELGGESDWALQIILQNIIEDPGYLLDEHCPYSSELKDLFKGAATVEPGAVEDVDLDLEAESRRLFHELKKTADSYKVDDNAEKMAYFRTSTSLLDKLVSMAERANNVRQISRFYQTVLDVMEQELEPGQITKVRDRLKEFTTQ